MAWARVDVERAAPRTLLHLSGAFVLGWLIARFVFSLLRATSVGPFFLQPGFFVIVGIACCLPLLDQRSRWRETALTPGSTGSFARAPAVPSR